MSFLRKHSVLLGFSSMAALALAIGCSSTAEESGTSSADDSAGDASTDAGPRAPQDLVISQVFGGGGNTGAAFSNDFVELFNRGDAPVGLKNVSVQYVGFDKNFANNAALINLPDVQLQPSHYYLIQLAGNTADAAVVGSALPSPDYVAATPVELINMSKSDGKIALVHSDKLLNACGAAATPCDTALIIDIVGFGKATQYEGAPTISLDSTKAAIRQLGGCMAFYDNAYDFKIDAPAPRSGATAPAALCSTVDAGAAPPPPVPPVTTDGGPTTKDSGTNTTDSGTHPDSGTHTGSSSGSGKGTTKGGSSSGAVIAPDDPAASGAEDPDGTHPTSAADGTVPPKFPATTPSCSTTMANNGSTSGLGAVFGLALVAGALRRRKK